MNVCNRDYEVFLHPPTNAVRIIHTIPMFETFFLFRFSLLSCSLYIRFYLLCFISLEIYDAGTKRRERRFQELPYNVLRSYDGLSSFYYIHKLYTLIHSNLKQILHRQKKTSENSKSKPKPSQNSNLKQILQRQKKTSQNIQSNIQI